MKPSWMHLPRLASAGPSSPTEAHKAARTGKARRIRLALAGGLVSVGGFTGLAVAAGPASASPSVSLVSSSQWHDPYGTTYVVGEVRNNGSGVASLVEIDADYYNKAGTLIGTDLTFAAVDNLNPGEKSPFEFVVASVPGYDHYRITGIYPSPYPSAPNHYFTTSVTSQSVDAAGYRHIVGSVRNDNTKTAEFVEPIFTFYNGAGVTVDEEFSFVNSGTYAALAPGHAASFEVLVDPSTPAFASYAILTQSSSPPSPPPPPFFTPRPGAATDIAMAANGSVWITGTNQVGGGYGIYHWTGTRWAAIPGGATTIASGPDGSPWVINSAHYIYHRTGSTWTLYPGAATDMAVGANGSVWITGTNQVGGGYGIYHWTGTRWAAIPGGATTIASGPDGSPWVINSAHHIYHRTGSTWTLYPGAATDMAVGANGSVWITGTNQVGGGYGIYHWTGTGWAAIPGGATTIASGPDGSPWVINSAHQIYAH